MDFNNEEYQTVSKIFWEKDRKLSDTIDILRQIRSKSFEEHCLEVGKIFDEKDTEVEESGPR